MILVSVLVTKWSRRSYPIVSPPKSPLLSVAKSRLRDHPLKPTAQGDFPNLFPLFPLFPLYLLLNLLLLPLFLSPNRTGDAVDQDCAEDGDECRK